MELKHIKDAKGFCTCIINPEDIITGDIVRQIREQHNVSRHLFAEIIGATDSVVESWENGEYPVTSCASRLLFLLYMNPHLFEQLYKIQGKI